MMTESLTFTKDVKVRAYFILFNNTTSMLHYSSNLPEISLRLPYLPCVEFYLFNDSLVGLKNPFLRRFSLSPYQTIRTREIVQNRPSLPPTSRVAISKNMQTVQQKWLPKEDIRK
jgi:hypothetical protein